MIINKAENFSLLFPQSIKKDFFKVIFNNIINEAYNLSSSPWFSSSPAQYNLDRPLDPDPPRQLWPFSDLPRSQRRLQGRTVYPSGQYLRPRSVTH